jgi:hypothetical protein
MTEDELPHDDQVPFFEGPWEKLIFPRSKGGTFPNEILGIMRNIHPYDCPQTFGLKRYIRQLLCKRNFADLTGI